MIIIQLLVELKRSRHLVQTSNVCNLNIIADGTAQELLKLLCISILFTFLDTCYYCGYHYFLFIYLFQGKEIIEFCKIFDDKEESNMKK